MRAHHVTFILNPNLENTAFALVFVCFHRALFAAPIIAGGHERDELNTTLPALHPYHLHNELKIIGRFLEPG